jgi:hypothetical protein
MWYGSWILLPNKGKSAWSGYTILTFVGEISTDSLSDEQIESLIKYINRRLIPESGSQEKADWSTALHSESKGVNDWPYSQPVENNIIDTEDQMGNWAGWC